MKLSPRLCFKSFQVPTHSVKLSGVGGWESTVFGQKDWTWLVWQPGFFLICVRRHGKHLGCGLKRNFFSQIGPFSSEILTAASQFSNIWASFFGIKYCYYGSDFVIRFSIISPIVSPNDSLNVLNAVFISLFEHSCDCQFQVFSSFFFNTSAAFSNYAQTSASRLPKRHSYFWVPLPQYVAILSTAILGAFTKLRKATIS